MSPNKLHKTIQQLKNLPNNLLMRVLKAIINELQARGAQITLINPYKFPRISKPK